MKVKDAIAIMNDTNATMDQLVQAEKTFRDAGLKGLLNKVQTIIGQRNRMPVDADIGLFAEAILTDMAFDRIARNDPAGLSAIAGALLLAKCERVIAETDRGVGAEKSLFEESFYRPDSNYAEWADDSGSSWRP